MSASFSGALVGAARLVDPREERFFRTIAAGEYPRASLAVLAELTAELVDVFPAQLRRLEAICEDEDARALLRENLAEEVGRDRDGVVHADRSHIALLRRFARAIGARRAEARSKEG